MQIRRRNREHVDGDFAPTDINTLLSNAVSGFRQRIHEDPDFKESFLSTMRAAAQASRETAAQESKDHAEAYGDTEDSHISDDVHAARSSALGEIVQLLEGASGADEYSALTPEAVADEFRGILGRMAREVYFQAQIEPPLQLQKGAVAVYFPGFGQVVHWEKVRGLEAQLDQVPGIAEALGGEQD